MPDGPAPPTVVVIDDDEAVRDALAGLFASIGIAVTDFGSIDAYLDAAPPKGATCLVLDIRLPGRSGIEYLEDLARAGMNKAIVCISGHADVAISVRAMKAGAVEFLVKPVREQDLLDAVQRALEHDLQQRTLRERIASVLARYDTLTARERLVMAHILAGRLNRQIAEQLGIAEATVKLHRGKVMRKMAAGSLIELVRAADLLPAAVGYSSSEGIGSLSPPHPGFASQRVDGADNLKGTR
jgi:FixJ family two-component response regulator